MTIPIEVEILRGELKLQLEQVTDRFAEVFPRQFHSKELELFVNELPTSKEEFAQVEGVGPTVAEQWASRYLVFIQPMAEKIQAAMGLHGLPGYRAYYAPHSHVFDNMESSAPKPSKRVRNLI